MTKLWYFCVVTQCVTLYERQILNLTLKVKSLIQTLQAKQWGEMASQSFCSLQSQSKLSSLGGGSRRITARPSEGNGACKLQSMVEILLSPAASECWIPGPLYRETHSILGRDHMLSPADPVTPSPSSSSPFLECLFLCFHCHLALSCFQLHAWIWNSSLSRPLRDWCKTNEITSF